MHLLKHHSTGAPQRRAVLIVIAVLSLTISLATRFAVPAKSQTHTLKSITSSLVEPQRQRLNRDSAQWVAPVTISVFAERVTVYARVVPPEPQLGTHLFDDNPYYRPPPSLRFLI